MLGKIEANAEGRQKEGKARVQQVVPCGGTDKGQEWEGMPMEIGPARQEEPGLISLPATSITTDALRQALAPLQEQIRQAISLAQQQGKPVMIAGDPSPAFAGGPAHAQASQGEQPRATRPAQETRRRVRMGPSEEQPCRICESPEHWAWNCPHRRTATRRRKGGPNQGPPQP